MRNDSIKLEDERMKGLTIANYPFIHERHRAFPEVFEDRKHENIIDISSGIGVVAKRILDNYKCVLSCNEVDNNCIKELKQLNINLTSHDLDRLTPLPFQNKEFDAIICLATLEHLVNIDFFAQELYRILNNHGRLYISVPNYASLFWMLPLIKGKTFHDPFDQRSRYEFYAHIRYFTYQSLLDYMMHFGFYEDTVYLTLPGGSTKFKEIRKRSRVKAFCIRNILRLFYMISPRWHQEPIVCFMKVKPKWKKRVKIL